MQWDFPQGMFGAFSGGSVNGSSQATTVHLEQKAGCLDHLSIERGELSEVKGTGQAHKEVAGQSKKAFFTVGVAGVKESMW